MRRTPAYISHTLSTIKHVLISLLTLAALTTRIAKEQSKADEASKQAARSMSDVAGARSTQMQLVATLQRVNFYIYKDI